MKEAPEKFALTHRSLLTIAVPVMLSNVTTPLLGIVDTAVVGQIADPVYIGAVAIGALIFSNIFWVFGFLRMSTTGFIAQADGAGDDIAMLDTVTRAMLIALTCGLALIVLSPFISIIAFKILPASAGVENYAREYFDIRIWSAPAALANYVFYGFFIGRGKAGIGLIFLLFVNGLNIILDAVFVLGLGMTADGVALGTLISEYAGAGLAAFFLWRETMVLEARWSLARAMKVAKLRQTLAVNSDIMVRSVLLVVAFSWFTAQSAKADDLTLAANTVLLNLLLLNGYLLDGFAFAAETYVGRAVGAGNRNHFWIAVRLTSYWAAGLAVLIACAVLAFGGFGIDLMTVNETARDTAHSFLFWLVLAPLFGAACFQLDGIFIGATWTRSMRNMMIIAFVLYILLWFPAVALLDNHGRWLALVMFFILRGITLTWALPKNAQRTFVSAPV